MSALALSTQRQYTILVEKMSWREATKKFFFGQGGRIIVVRIIAFFGLPSLPLTLLDDIFDLVPGIDVITIGDDFFAAFGLYAFFAIRKIRKDNTHYFKDYR